MKAQITLLTVLVMLLGTTGISAAWHVSSRAARKANPQPATKESLKAGAAAWKKECASCHGNKGKGDGPEASKLEEPLTDLSVKSTLADQTDGTLFFKITEGRSPMPGYKKTLSKNQRWHLVNFMRSLAK